MDQADAQEGDGDGEGDQEEADEEEEGTDDPVTVSQAGAARSAEKKSKQIRHRMVVTQHPVSTKKRRTSKTPTKRLDDSYDSAQDAPAPENIDSDDEPVFADPEDLQGPNLSRKTRRFSQIGRAHV